jgi:translation initiation factor IF-2
MAKIRVLDVAEEELEKEKLLAKLKKMGVKVKEEEMEDQGSRWGATERVIRDEEGAEFIERRVKPTVIRRRARTVEVEEEIPTEVQGEAQEVLQGEVAEALEEERPVTPPPVEERVVESPVEVAEGTREEVAEAPPEEVIPSAPVEAKLAELKEEEEEVKVKKKKAKAAEQVPEEPLPRKRVAKRRIVEEAELETARRYPRVPREQVVKPLKVPKKKVEFITVKKTLITTPKPIKRVIRIAEAIMVSELAKRMGVKATEVIKKLMEMGTVATINQAGDVDLASLVAGEFEYEV